jgi:hypothetical protein
MAFTTRSEWLAGVPAPFTPAAAAAYMGALLEESAKAVDAIEIRAAMAAVATRLSRPAPPAPWPLTPAYVAAKTAAETARDSMAAIHADVTLTQPNVTLYKRIGVKLIDETNRILGDKDKIITPAKTSAAAKQALSIGLDLGTVALALILWHEFGRRR